MLGASRPAVIDPELRKRLTMARESILSVYAVFALMILLAGCSQNSEGPSESMKDIESAVSGLLASQEEDAFLVVTIPGTPDFVQMSGFRGSAELDFPQIMDRQRRMRPKIEAVCEELGLTQRVTLGSDGSEFLNYDLPRDAGTIAEIVRKILSDVFEVSELSPLEFEWNGFEWPND